METSVELSTVCSVFIFVSWLLVNSRCSTGQKTVLSVFCKFCARKPVKSVYSCPLPSPIFLRGGAGWTQAKTSHSWFIWTWNSRFGPLHICTSPEKFKSGVSPLKTYQMFPVHNASEKFENAAVTGHFRFAVEENSDMPGNYIILVMPSFSKSSVFKMFFVYTNSRNAGLFKFLRFGFEKLSFRDGLVWTIGLTVQIKLGLKISPTRVWTGS